MKCYQAVKGAEKEITVPLPQTRQHLYTLCIVTYADKSMWIDLFIISREHLQCGYNKITSDVSIDYVVYE